MPELKLYTIAQLREWVMQNNAVEGLSDKMVSRTRAYALVNNPYVKDDDPVVASIFVDGENAAYVTAFPEIIGEKRYWWFSALWCNPKYQGCGYGLIVVGSLAEIYGNENCLDRWGAKETVEIFTHLGLQTQYTLRFVLGTKINQETRKGRLVYSVRTMQKWFYNRLRKTPKGEYAVKYIPCIDDETYEFIQSHSQNYYFHHAQDFLNWVLQYPFSIAAPLTERVETTMPFSQSEAYKTHLYAVQVKSEKKIIGFYVLKEREDALHVLYMYYDEEYKNNVYASIRDHINRLSVLQCVTENGELAKYLRKYIYFAKNKEEKVSFSYDINTPPMQSKLLQFADGDCFTA